MAKNPIQFQRGLSIANFMSQYGSTQQCHRALFHLRWPKGFVCPQCGNTTYCQLNVRALYQCHRCRHQTSVTAGTVFDKTKLPLTTWFLALYRLTQSKKGVSALELSRDLGVNYKTAWSIKHKVMRTMRERDQNRRLSGRIEMDDAYLGGEMAGVGGRGSPNKIPFIAVVETTEDKHPLRIQLRTVSGFRHYAIANWAYHNLTPGSTVWSDGLACFAAVKQAQCRHIPVVTGGGRQAVQSPAFKWVNTLLGNVKNSLRGTYHAFRAKYAARYLAEFEYRFNRRFDLPSMIERLASAAARTPPLPARLLMMAESHG